MIPRSTLTRIRWRERLSLEATDDPDTLLTLCSTIEEVRPSAEPSRRSGSVFDRTGRVTTTFGGGFLEPADSGVVATFMFES